jgi:hypothetical protein
VFLFTLESFRKVKLESTVEKILFVFGVNKLLGRNPTIKYTRIEINSKLKGKNFQSLREKMYSSGIW